MFYFDRDNFRIVELSVEDVIHQFGKETPTPYGVGQKYFFEDGYIWTWDCGGKRHRNFECTEEESKKILLDWAVENAAADTTNGGTLIYETKQEVLDDLKHEIEEESAWDLEDAWDVETRNKLIQVLNENTDGKAPEFPEIHGSDSEFSM